MKKILAILGVVLLPNFAFAPASQLEIDPSLESHLRMVWSNNGVDETTQDALIIKLENGEMLDAMENSEAYAVEEIGARVIHRYPDGSINIIRFGDTSLGSIDVLAPQAIGDCNRKGSSGGTNCLISGWFSGVQLGFRASYNTPLHGAANIYGYHTPTVQCFPGLSCSSPSWNIVRTSQSGQLPAQVGISTTWTFLGAGGSSTTHLRLFAYNTSAWTD